MGAPGQAIAEATSLLYLGMRDASLRGMFSWPAFCVFFTSRLKVNLYALDEMGFLGVLGKARWWQGGKVHAGTGCFAHSTSRASTSLGSAGSTGSGAAQGQGGTANLKAYCQ